MGEDGSENASERKDIPIKLAMGTDQNFLNLLRAANPGDYSGDNDDTLRAGNSNGHKHVPSHLSDLFEPPQEQPGQAPSPQSPPSTIQSTKPLPPRPPPKPDTIHKRNRSVSFDKDALMQRPISDMRAQQSTLMEFLDEASIASHASSGFSKTSLSHPLSVNLGMVGRRQQSARKLTIDDLLGAGKYETEAETSILKALEEHQQQSIPASHKRFQSETSTILTGLPDSLAHDFSMDGESKSDESELKGDTFTDDDDDDDDEVVSSHRSSLSKQQSRPLLSAETSRNVRQHRKTMSIEDRLAGLTIAMWNMGDSAASEEFSGFDGSSPESSGEQFGKAVAMLAGHEAPMPPRSRLDSTGSRPSGLAVVEESDEVPTSSEDATGKDAESMDDIEGQLPTDSPFRKTSKRRKPHRNHRRSSLITGATDKLKDDMYIWKTFFRPRREHMAAYIKRTICYVVLPFVGIAAILFYFAGNPSTGKSIGETSDEKASISWWLLFVVRQVTTMSFALGLQVVIIDFMSISTKVMLRLLGPLLTLLLVQSKGWPFVVFCWSILNFGLLYGDNDFVQHWGFFQDYVGLFNDDNPSGGVVGSEWNRRVLLIGATVSFFVVLKRFVVGLLLGRQTFRKYRRLKRTDPSYFVNTQTKFLVRQDHYGEQLAKVMNKMVLIGQVGHLSKRIYKSHSSLRQGETEATA